MDGCVRRGPWPGPGGRQEDAADAAGAAAGVEELDDDVPVLAASLPDDEPDDEPDDDVEPLLPAERLPDSRESVR